MFACVGGGGVIDKRTRYVPSVFFFFSFFLKFVWSALLMYIFIYEYREIL